MQKTLSYLCVLLTTFIIVFGFSGCGTASNYKFSRLDALGFSGNADDILEYIEANPALELVETYEDGVKVERWQTINKIIPLLRIVLNAEIILKEDRQGSLSVPFYALESVVGTEKLKAIEETLSSLENKGIFVLNGNNIEIYFKYTEKDANGSVKLSLYDPFDFSEEPKVLNLGDQVNKYFSLISSYGIKMDDALSAKITKKKITLTCKFSIPTTFKLVSDSSGEFGTGVYEDISNYDGARMTSVINIAFTR